MRHLLSIKNNVVFGIEICTARHGYTTTSARAQVAPHSYTKGRGGRVSNMDTTSLKTSYEVTGTVPYVSVKCTKMYLAFTRLVTE
jgi:hypothetical protein